MFPGYIYRPGNQNLDEFITEMDEGFSTVTSNAGELILLENFSVDCNTTNNNMQTSGIHLDTISAK